MKRSLAIGLLGILVLAHAPVTAGEKPRDLGAAVAPIHLVPKGADPISVGGLHSYFGTIEIGSAGDGLVISNSLPLEKYLLGLAEVPLTWPGEALKAQAVAARTYALYTLGRPPAGAAATYGFDICASVDCQVYSGADVVAPIVGGRWREAVAATAGQAVLYRGRPILARYHSTSGGATLDNPQAFPEEGAYPYLQGVPSTTEQGSPLYRWTVGFTLRRMQRLLEAAGRWGPGEGRLLEVISRPSRSGFHYPDLVFRGQNGSVTATAEEIRAELRDLAPRLFPQDYPSLSPAGTGRLPETFPSNRIDVFTKDRVVTVIGRGWGHGVGMSQWGAHGLAARGAGYLDILTHYYSGVQVGETPDPGPLEVGLDWAESSVSVQGRFKVVDGRGRTLVNDALGEWDFDWGGAGVVAIDPPPGFGLPLTVGLVQAPRTVTVGEPAYFTVALSRPARVRTMTAASSGYDDPGAKVAAAGRRRIVWLAPLEPGTVEVQVEARAGPKTSRTEPISIEVARAPTVQARGAPEQGGSRAPREMDEGGSPALVAAIVAALLLVVGFVMWASARRKLPR